MKKTIILATATIGLVMSSCGLGKGGSDEPDAGMQLFPVSKDIELGAQVAHEIESNPAEYPILDSASNVEAYKYIYDIRDKVLATGKVEHKDDFKWQIRIIEDDETLNAFCTPGGYIYFYTGIIKYLDDESQLAGVMGHEMAHADLRHSIRQMQKSMGVQILLSAVLGDSSALGQITGGLVGLKFSRSHETEADRKSVAYLCETDWPADGGAGFFEKIAAGGNQTPPEFMSTHPSPDNRIENYHSWAAELSCPGKELYKERYDKFKALF
ncbi:MAG: M48 family metalloprotease [Crocinitomicaceae bacterium]